MKSFIECIDVGKIYRGRMVDVVASNQKLRDRARRIVMELTGADEKQARNLLKQARFRPKLAIAMHALGLSAAEAGRRLDEVGGDLHALIPAAARRRRRRR